MERLRRDADQQRVREKEQLVSPARRAVASICMDSHRVMDHVTGSTALLLFARGQLPPKRIRRDTVLHQNFRSICPTCAAYAVKVRSSQLTISGQGLATQLG